MANGFNRLCVLPLALLLISLPVRLSAANEEAPIIGSVFQVSMDVKQDNFVISQPTVLMTVGKQVELSWSGTDGVLQNFRLNLLAEEVDGSIVKLSTQIFEQADNKSILHSSPQILMKQDSEASFRSDFKSNALGDLTMEFIVNKVIVDLDGNIQDCANNGSGQLEGLPKQEELNCPVINAPLLSAVLFNSPEDADFMVRGGSCCSVSCGDIVLTCCGAIGCCDAQCGGCCHRQ